MKFHRRPWSGKIGVTPAYVAFLVALLGLPVAAYVTLVQHSRQQALQQAEEFSRVVSVVRSFYASNVSGRVLAHGGPVTVTERYRSVDGGIPIPATLSIELGEAISRQAQSRGTAFSFSFLSDAPFRNRQRPAPDAFQLEALQRFRGDASLLEHWRVDGDRMRYAVPVRMEAPCVACHNHHPDSPARDWKVGDVRGLQDVSVAISMTTQAGDSALLGAYLLFFVAASSAALREYRRGNRSLLVLNERLEAGRRTLEDLAEDLRTTGERQAALLDTATSGIVLVDRDRRVLAANRRMHQMLGLDAGELAGSATRSWFRDDDAWRRIDDAFEDLWRGATRSGEWTLVRSDGGSFVARLTGRAVDAADRGKGSVWVIDDITAEHEAAEQLRRAKELAEDSARAKSNFLANMTHEIRTPMNAVLGMTYLALKTDLDARQRDYLNRIQAAGRHLLGVINDILDYSRIEAGKMPVEHVDFDLEQTLDHALALVAHRAHQKGLELVADLPASVPRSLRGDPRHLTQVLVNLLNNAVKFTERGWVHVEVSARPDAQPAGLMLHVAVTDSGVGIAEEHLGRLFSSFEQADASTTRKYGGTGLGLAICRHLVQLLGGEIGVRSRLGDGSTFWFTTRVQVRAARPPGAEPGGVQARADVLHADARPLPRLGPVLVVDDVPLAAQSIVAMLGGLGVPAQVACDGPRAAELIRAAAEAGCPFDVVLVDAGLPPGPDGHPPWQGWSDASGRPALVLMCVDGEHPQSALSVADGIAGTIDKPVLPAALARVLGRLESASDLQPVAASISPPGAPPVAAPADTAPAGAAVGRADGMIPAASLLEQAHALARQLLVRLDAGDTEVLPMLRTHDALLRRWLQQRHAPFARAVEAFDFETGHRILAEALRADQALGP